MKTRIYKIRVSIIVEISRKFTRAVSQWVDIDASTVEQAIQRFKRQYSKVFGRFGGTITAKCAQSGWLEFAKVPV